MPFQEILNARLLFFAIVILNPAPVIPVERHIDYDCPGLIETSSLQTLVPFRTNKPKCLKEVIAPGINSITPGDKAAKITYQMWYLIV